MLSCFTLLFPFRRQCEDEAKCLFTFHDRDHDHQSSLGTMSVGPRLFHIYSHTSRSYQGQTARLTQIFETGGLSTRSMTLIRPCLSLFSLCLSPDMKNKQTAKLHVRQAQHLQVMDISQPNDRRLLEHPPKHKPCSGDGQPRYQ